MADKRYIAKTIAVSGGFDPIHVGHLNMFEQAKELVGPSGKLIVFVNSDNFLIKKKGRPFMALEDRMRLIEAMEVVDEVFAVVDNDLSVCETLRKYKPDIFANGGDRKLDNIPEVAVCEELGIEMIFNIGGEKVRSSSTLLEKYQER
jgi:D-beta-D-heptose 7-phosphate kinase/D-beta-D-heptose 1-phosphate adenosyltransferase